MKLVIEKFKSRQGRMTLVGAALFVAGMMSLPPAVLSDAKLFNACLGGALIGLGFTLAFFAVTNSADLRESGQPKESTDE